MIFKISNLDISGKLMRDFFYIVILGMGRIVIYDKIWKWGNFCSFSGIICMFYRFTGRQLTSLIK